jgi:hypothetical protein
MSSKALTTKLQAIAAQAPKIISAGERATLEGGKISIGGKEVSELPGVVIIAAVQERTYYPTAYQAGQVEAPACYSYTDKPHEQAIAPQSETCAECPMNQWGSNGRGKACKERVKVAFMPAAGGPIVTMRAPVTSTANYGKFLSAEKVHGYVASLQHETTIKASRHPKWGNVTQVEYIVGPKLEEDAFGHAVEAYETAYDMLTQPYETE